MDKDFKRKFLKGSASTLIGQVISMIFHFVSIMILTRVLTKEDFGVYALILLIDYFFLTLSGLGLDVTLVKFISGEGEEEKKAASSKIFLFKILSLTFFAILFLLASELFLPFFDEKITDYKIYIAVLIFLGGFRDFFFRVLQGLNYFKKYAITQIVTAISRLALIICFHTLGDLTLDNLILIEVLTVVVVLIIEVIFVPFRKIYDRRINYIKTKIIINFALPIYLNNLFGFAFSRMNLFIIGILLNPVSVAYYDVAGKIPEALKKMFNPFMLVYFPSLSNLLSKGNKSSAEELINKSLNIFSMLLAITVLISFLFRNEIIVLLFSDKYVESSLLFSLLMLNITFIVYKNILGYANLAAGYPKVPMIVNIVSSVIGIGGSIIMIPIFGLVGAACSLLIMNFIGQVLLLFYLEKINLNVNALRYAKPIILLVITIMLYLLLNNSTISIKILSVLFFIVLNWIFVPDFKSFMYYVIKYVPKL